ncbi:MAG: hypothetical protein DIU70_006485 [Bacillota bacterium]
MYLLMCNAVEYMQRWTKLAFYAAQGVQACETAGIRDKRLVLLLWGLGRGNIVLGRYREAARAYEKAIEVAQKLEADDLYWVSRRSRAVCLERLGGSYRLEAEREYRSVFSQAANGRVRMAAAANLSWLLYTSGDTDAAYDVAVTAALALSPEAKIGAPWAALLRNLAFLEILRGRADLADPMIEDAFVAAPGHSCALRATLAAVKALAEHRMGRPDESQRWMATAWDLLDSEPDLTAREMVFMIESMVEGGK